MMPLPSRPNDGTDAPERVEVLPTPAGQLTCKDVSRREFLAGGAAGAIAMTIGSAAMLMPQLTAEAAEATFQLADTKSSEAKDSAPNYADYTVHIKRGTMAPDGRSREVFVYDDQLPGPVIRAKLGQTLRVKVVNQLDIPSSIHWHGMHQPGTWQMDGVDGVSRPPIPPGQEFTYEFKATPAGTHWYHSHTGVQYSDGLFGPLVVDEPTPPAKYDREEIVFINDWFVEQSDAILAGLLNPPAAASADKKSGDKTAGTEKMSGMDSKSSEMAKMAASDAGAAKADNAKGMSGMPGMEKAKPGGMQSVMVPGKSKAAGMSGAGGKSGMAGMEMGGKPDIGDVPFESGLINGKGRFGNDAKAPLASIQVKRGETIRLRLISGTSTYQFRFQIDGHPLTVIATDGAPMKPVEVDSLVLSPGERYDVLLKANGSGSAWIRAVTLAGDEVRAVLRYPDASAGEPPTKAVVWGKRELKPEQMKSLAPVAIAEKPQEITLKLGGSMAPYWWDINGQRWPDADPIKLGPNLPIRFVIENPTMMDHPFHLHGHYFFVLGKPGALNMIDPVRKDSINIPSKSTMVLQWLSTNPGHWFFHCHIEWHLATGMAREIEIS